MLLLSLNSFESVTVILRNYEFSVAQVTHFSARVVLLPAARNVAKKVPRVLWALFTIGKAAELAPVLLFLAVKSEVARVALQVHVSLLGWLSQEVNRVVLLKRVYFALNVKKPTLFEQL